MTRYLRHPLAGIVAAAVLLTGILGWLVADRVRVLAAGREIVLEIRPVDPRDLFKGDYVRLGFDISRLDPALLTAIIPPDEAGRRRLRSDAMGRPMVYVTLQEETGGNWKAVAASLERPAALPADRVVMKGRLDPWSRNTITYGIERYFVPEGTGKRLEDLARTQKLAAIVAVDRSGRAAIKGLVAEGRRVYEEPLF